MYLIIGKADGYIEESNGVKYLVFASTDGNRSIDKVHRLLLLLLLLLLLTLFNIEIKILAIIQK